MRRHAAGLAAGFCLLYSAGPAGAQIFLPGAFRLDYSKAALDNVACVHRTLFNKPLIIDASLTFLRQGTLDQPRVLWTSPWGLDTYMNGSFSGKNYFSVRESESEQVDNTSLPSEFLPPGETTNQGRWTLNKNYSGPATADIAGFVQNVYKISSTELLGFIHVERCDRPMSQTPVPDRLYAIGLAYSSNSGKNWTYAGDVIRPGYDKLGDVDAFGGNPYYSNIGGVPFTIVKEAGADYFYVYYNEYTLTPAYPTKPSSRSYTAVARAKVTDAIADAKAGWIARPWKKYRPATGGDWLESGLTGTGIAVLPCTLDDFNAGFFDMHSRAAFSPFLQRHILLANAVEWEGGVGGRLYRRLVLFTSMNGIDWARKKVVDESYGDNPSNGYRPGYNLMYGSFVSSSGASDDYSQIGRNFSLIYPRQYNADYANSDLYSVPISSVPDLTPSYTALD